LGNSREIHRSKIRASLSRSLPLQLTSPNRIRLINIAHYRRIIIAKYVSPKLSEFINPPGGLTSCGRDRAIAITEIRAAR